MARPTEFDQANHVWRGWPADQDREAVDDLHTHLDTSAGRSISCWQLTADEIAEVMRTGRVWLHVYGVHPPVYVGGEDPFSTEGEA